MCRERNLVEKKTRVNGIDVHGSENPLNQPEINALVEQVNQNPVLHPNILKATHFAWQGDTDTVPQIVGYELGWRGHLQFVDAHYQALSQIVGKSIKGVDVELTRMVVNENESVGPASYHLGYLVSGFKDSAGTDGNWHPSPYNPTVSAYYNHAHKIDYGEVHEMGHRVLHLPDTYSIDTVLSPTGNDILANVPQPWLTYMTHKRNDRGPDLMNGGLYMGEASYRLDPYATWLLQRRFVQGWQHDLARAIPEGAWNFPHEVPNETTLEAKGWEGASLTIFRTDGTEMEKHLAEEPVFSGQFNQDGKITIGDPFEGVDNSDGFVPNYRSLLLLKATRPDGTIGVRYMDIGDFNMATGLKGEHSSRAEMRLIGGFADVSDPNVTPENFNWTILRNPIDVYMPIVAK
ncbi:hypothetical protein IPM62_01470 [Candidatus Woesebacteria bacterium]|nr:MAG: hypothetical protein IPM62_01470 [Candidatus Woesebacteria bacterium]